MSSIIVNGRDNALLMQQLKTCVIVPTYNNSGTVIQVVRRIMEYAKDIIVVNDGSTDDTHRLLTEFITQEKLLHPETRITLISYENNRGKGHALRIGFAQALDMGFVYAVTIDSDGQHYPEDLPIIIAALKQQDEEGLNRVLIVGNRKLQQKNMPKGNTFANYFSNFWFMLQTWQYLPDTQTGYRIYPLQHLTGLSLLTARYEAELELLVMQAWHGVKLISVPIRVYYPPKGERISHFRPFLDFARIFLLNTVLCILCLCFGWWSMLWYICVNKKGK